MTARPIPVLFQRATGFRRLLSMAALSGLVAFTSAAQANPSLVFDLKTGQVLAEQQAFQRWYPASLTKLMTAYVTFRAVKAGELTLTSPIRVSKLTAAEPPSKMGYKPGNEMTLDNALKMMLVKSANDIAAAVAENVGGTLPAFVERMNAEAARLGMVGSHFTNPNGLHSPDNYTTARDLAVLVTAIRSEFPQYDTYFRIEGLKAGKSVMKTYNKLIGRFEGADGMKTGFVCASGFNLIGTATRDGNTLGAIVLGATLQKDRAEIAAEMLVNAFQSMPTSSETTIYSLQRSGAGLDTPVDMRDVVCKKPDKNEKKPAASEDATAETMKTSPFLPEMTRQPTLVAVGLGGANGPIPAARAALGDQDYADVPIPTARPAYNPADDGGKATAQGDSAATAN